MGFQSLINRLENNKKEEIKETKAKEKKNQEQLGLI